MRGLNEHILSGYLFLFDACICRLSPSDRIETLGTLRAPGGIGHISTDLRLPGQMLVAGRHALRSTDGALSIQNVAGSPFSGYNEGVGSRARFSTISGFLQIGPNSVVVLDRFNHCVRLIDRDTRNTSTLAGQCSSKGYLDGPAANFNEPYDIIQNTLQENQFLVSDRANNAVRIISGRNVSTLIKSDQMPLPKGMAQDKTSGSLYIISACGLVMYDFVRQTISVIISPSSVGFADGGLDNTKMFYPKEVALLSSRALIVSDPNNRRLRLIDLTTNTTKSVCSGKQGYKDRNLTECRLYTPWSIHLQKNVLYIGDRKEIRFIKGAYLPTWPSGGITEDQAERFCNETLLKSPALSKCTEIPALAKEALENCMNDIKVNISIYCLH